jgi:hypothetical protein
VRTAFAVATAAAVIATAGDLLMLWVANALRAGFAIASPPVGALRLGAALGVVAIPLYALGWAAAAARAAHALGRGAPWVMVAGGLGAILGAYIHAATASLVEEQARGRATTPIADPLAGVMAAGPPLLVPWALATVLVVAASAAMVYAARRAAVPRSWQLANPAVVTVLLALGGATSELGRAFLVPAAPNVAHVVFFATALASCGRLDRRPAEG